jgi:hypothetical protein
MEAMAREHPGLLAGLWFGAAALLPAAAIGVYYLLLLAAEGPLIAASDLPLDLIMSLYLVLLPPLLAFMCGGLIGRRIFVEPVVGRWGAAGLGAGAGAAWLLVWVGMGEILARLLGLQVPSKPDPALMAFGYGMVAVGSAVVIIYNALVGIWLLENQRKMESVGLEDTQPGGIS